MSTVRSLSVHVSLGVVPLPSGSLTQCVDLKWAWIILLDPELWWFLSFEICEDKGNELTSVLWRHKLLPPRQKVPNLITAWGFPASVCSVLLFVHGFSLCHPLTVCSPGMSLFASHPFDFEYLLMSDTLAILYKKRKNTSRLSRKIIFETVNRPMCCYWVLLKAPFTGDRKLPALRYSIGYIS